MMEMKQGNRTVTDFAIDFRARARESQWNTAALCKAFVFRLEDYIKDEMVSHKLPAILDGLIELATRIDLHIRFRQRGRRGESSSLFHACQVDRVTPPKTHSGNKEGT